MIKSNVTHSEFISNYHKKNVDFLWNRRKVPQAFYELSSEVKNFKESIVKNEKVSNVLKMYEDHKNKFFLLNFLIMLTPLRIVIVFSIMFAAFMFMADKFCEKALISAMLSSEKSYEDLQLNSIVSVRLRD